MSDSIDAWNEYFHFLSSREGSIINVANYLSKRLNLLEKSTFKLENVFPIYNIIMLVYDDDFLPEKTLKEKIAFLQKSFDILFNYSKNLLTKFDIYREKYIQTNTSQIVEYLSKLPYYEEYLSTMGYDFHDREREWRIVDTNLTDEMKITLECMTMCCSLGYDYWDNYLRYMPLSIFNQHRLSIEKLVKTNDCEYCSNPLDPVTFQCTMCRLDIDKMTFFDDWEYRIDGKLKHGKSLELLDQNFKNNQTFQSLRSAESLKLNNVKYENVPPVTNTNNNPNQDEWICRYCTMKNISTLNCLSCYNLNETVRNVFEDRTNRIENIIENEGKINDTHVNDWRDETLMGKEEEERKAIYQPENYHSNDEKTSDQYRTDETFAENIEKTKLLSQTNKTNYASNTTIDMKSQKEEKKQNIFTRFCEFFSEMFKELCKSLRCS